MYKVESDIDIVIKKQLQNLEQLAQGDKILREAALNTVVLISDRVQQKGKKTDETAIGEYSTKKLKFKAITGKFSSIANKKQQKKHKGGDEFDGGYKEFREKLGRQTEFIDLTLTGDMMGDFIAEPAGKTSWEVGFRGKESSDKAQYHEERFGPIFQLSNSELEQIKNIVDSRIDDILGK